MTYMIDGHNLIPKIRGMSLSAEDDEQQLIRWLQAFCSARHKPVEVYFDQAAAGHAGRRSFGMVKATFVPASSSADEAIRRRLAQLGKSAKNWTVVTSDRRVQAEARSLGAQVRTSEEFARVAQQVIDAHSAREVPPPQLSGAELEEWLKLFNSKKDK